MNALEVPESAAARMTEPVVVASERLEAVALLLGAHLPTVPAQALDGELPGLLGEVGESVAADWCFMFRFSSDGSLMSLTHQWLRRGGPVSPTPLQRIRCQEFPWLVEQLRSLRPVVVPNVMKLPVEGAAERELFVAQGVAAVTLIPMPSRLLLGGFFGLGASAPGWSLDERQLLLLRLTANALAGAVERASIELALRDSHGNLQALLDNLDDYLLILDHTGRILHANPMACCRLGYPMVDLKQLTFVDLYPPKSRSAVRSLLAEEGRPNRPLGLLPLLTSDGAEIPVETRLMRGSWNGQQVLLAVCRDVSERERAQDGMRQSEARTSAVLEALPDTILRLRADGSIIDPLPGEVLTPGEGELAVELHPSVASACRQGVKEALASRQLQVVEFELETLTGIRLYEARLAVLGEDEVLAIVRDISERARLEQMKADFINRASHELRTPVTTALLMVDLIQEGGEELELQEYWGILRLELHRQHELVEDLLTVGRLDAGRMRMNMAPVDLMAVLRDSVEHSGPLAESRRITLQTRVAGELPSVLGDTTALQRVFANLLDNAVKFTPAGGEVRLEAAGEPSGVRISVTDNGIGIPEDEQRNLFERFFRASNAVRAEIQGTGVGLYIVRSIVEAHNGRVKVQSAIDQGTTFEVWLPAGADEPTAVELD